MGRAVLAADGNNDAAKAAYGLAVKIEVDRLRRFYSRKRTLPKPAAVIWRVPVLEDLRNPT